METAKTRDWVILAASVIFLGVAAARFVAGREVAPEPSAIATPAETFEGRMVKRAEVARAEDRAAARKHEGRAASSSPAEAAASARVIAERGYVPRAPVIANPALDAGNAIIGIFFLVAMCAVYFAPALVASSRLHRNRYAIFALDLLLGWTVLGWIVALIWSLTDTSRPDL